MTVKFTNNASTTVGTGINASATSLTVASASSFPSLSGADDYCYLTIQGATNSTREVVKATALSSNTFTIVRAQDNTSAGTWAAGDVVELRMTAALLTDVIDAATVEGVKTNYQYTPTAGQTVFSGADNASATMIINQAALVSVYMNGVRLVQGTDYSVSSANNTVTLGIGATTADIIDIEVYGNFVGQSGAAVGITGGSITGTAITATSLGATGTATLNTLVSNNATISGGSLDGVTIGGTTRGAISGNAISGTSFASTGNMTFGDNDKAIFGAGSDLQIYHDGSNSYIKDDGTGNLFIQGTSLQLENAAGENFVNCVSDGTVAIYFNNAKRFETTSTGIDVTGSVTASGIDINGAAPYIKFLDTSGDAYAKIDADSPDEGTIRIQADPGNSGANSIIRFDVDGSERMRIDASGNVGIGTNNPTAYGATGTTLEVKGVSGSGSGLIKVTGADGVVSGALYAGGSTTMIIGTQTNHAFAFSTNNTERMRIDARGVVGINAVPEAWDAAFSSVLQVGAMSVLTSGGDNARIFGNAYYDGGAYYKRINTGHAQAYEQGAGRHIWYNAASGAADSTFAWVESMRIDANGNLLVGTTNVNPSQNAVEGIALSAGSYGGYFSAARSGGVVAQFARLTSTGSILDFRNSTASVGGIGTFGYDTYIGTGIVGIRFNDGGSALTPLNTTSGSIANSDNIISLGEADKRFKDLHLSGTATMGGVEVSDTDDIRIRLLNGATFKAGIQVATTAGDMIAGSAVDDLAVRSQTNMLFSTGGNTERMRIDASGNLVVGGTSLSAASSVGFTPTGNIRQVFASGVANDSIFAAISGVSNGFQITQDTSNNQKYIFHNGGTPSVTIDSSGNLLVGKTSNTISAAGAKLGTGGSNFTRSGNEVVYFNRTTNDGEIATFAKDGTTVGSWQSRAGLVSTIILDPRSGGMGLTGSGSRFTPTNESGVESDNRNDIGTSTYRFKDLYLSGGVYLGGTGAANKLDDYEEGTWTPDLIRNDGSVSASFGVVSATYVKIGSIVVLKAFINSITAGNSNGNQYWRINGVPYASAVQDYSGEALAYNSTGANNVYVGDAGGNLILCNNANVWTQALTGQFMLNITYRVV